ncbi:hypothetical protein [Amycolatopsis sp. NPDC004079]|uniref:hypothetical protein n=1 Tax=Amycolatopsis sp. NPDC004079 TaxID=3154549 RepID=UPI0033B703CD
MATSDDETRDLAASLHTYLKPLRLTGLTAVQATRLVTYETVCWADEQGWKVAYEVWGRITRPSKNGPMRARLDLVCTRPAKQPAVAIEIDRDGKTWSLQKLQAEAAAGRVALWVRWHGHTQAEIPDAVGLVDIHDTADYQRPRRTPRKLPALGSPSAQRNPEEGTVEPLFSAPRRPDPPVLPSPDAIEAARTPAGGFTRAQLAAWGVAWPPPKGWKKELTDRWHAAQTELRDA